MAVGVALTAIVAASCQSTEPERAAPLPSLPSTAPVQEAAQDEPSGASNRWSKLFGGGDELGQYRSLTEMVRHAPQIVRGVVVDVEPGRVVGDPEDGPEYLFQEVYFVLRAEEVVAGDAFRPDDEIRMGVGGVQAGADIRSRFSDVVGDEGLFFLIQFGAPQPEFDRGTDPNSVSLDVYRPVTGQGVYVNDQGKALAARLADPGFHRQLHGMPFEELVQQVAALAAED